ncbi:MAG: hypothetical protein WC514_01170 [Candidatus Paceibacterota bacterium]
MYLSRFRLRNLGNLPDNRETEGVKNPKKAKKKVPQHQGFTRDLKSSEKSSTVKTER